MKRFYGVLRVIILLIAINMFSGVSAQESSSRNIKNSVFKNAAKSGEFVLPSWQLNQPFLPG
jgi:hypothetical protein